jgi:hypothetical protein
LADPLLAAYRDARTASIQAASDTATVAAAVRAPSRIHITARTATQATSGRPAAAERDPADSAALRDPGMNPPGPGERILHGLGVTRPDALQQAATIDRGAEHLILETAHQPHRRRSSFPANDVSTSASTAAIINHLLASGDPRAAAILHPPAPRKSAQPEIEP